MESEPQSTNTNGRFQRLHAPPTPSSTSGTTSSKGSRQPVPIGRELASAARQANTPVSTCFPLHVLPVDRSKRRVMPMVDRRRSMVDQGLKDILNQICRAALNWPLTLTGGVGTGKTCAMLCLCDGIPGSIYKTMDQFIEDLAVAARGDLYDNDSGAKVSVPRYWAEWHSAPFVVLDEIGARTNVSDHYCSTLLRAINERQGAPAAFISNLDIASIDSIIDARIASRLASGTVTDTGTVDRRIGGRNGPV